MISIERIVAIIPSRKSYIATFQLDGTFATTTRIATHAQDMLAFLQTQPGASLLVQAPPWKLSTLETTENLRLLHGLAETAIRWAAVAEILEQPIQVVPRFAWLNDLGRAGLLRRNEADRPLFHELARRKAPDAPRDLSEVICFGVWASTQLPRLEAFTAFPVVAA